MPRVVPFETFWKWLQGHPNCIVSAGTPEAVLYDHDDFHWHFGAEGEEGAQLIQLIRGKNLVGELVIDARSVTYVQIEHKGEEEYLFDCVEENTEGAVAAYTFTLSHDYDPEEAAPQGRWVH